LPHAGTTRRSIERDIDEEIRFHLHARIEDLMRHGLSREDAEAKAATEYGDAAAARRELAAIDHRAARRQGMREWIGGLAQDLRFALRGLRARPGFAATVLLTLALGIGANAAIFTVVDAVLVRPLPYARPDRLVHLWETYRSKVDGRSEASFPDYVDWRARNHALVDLAGYQGSGFVLGGATPQLVGAGKTTANFFDVLGVKPILGRTFASTEDAPDAPRVVVLTYGFWQRQFAGDRNVIGKAITLDDAPATVIGLLPKQFTFARQAGAEVWTPIDRSAAARRARGNHWLNIVGRLKPGTTIAAAAADMSAIMRDLARDYPPTNTGRDAQVVPLHQELVGSVRPVLLLLYGAVLVVLLIACVNVANLLLIRGAERGRELAVRVALGAGKARLIRQLLTESVLLALLGGMGGLAVANVGVHWLVGLLPQHPIRGIPNLSGIALDVRIVAYAVGVSLIAGIGLGIVPALRITRPALYDSLKSAGRGAIGGASKVRDMLVVGEIALTVVLLSGALLFGRSVMRLLAINPGFRVEHTLTSTVILTGAQQPGSVPASERFQRLSRRVREIPGVESVGFVSKLPLDFGNSLGLNVVGLPKPAPGDDPTASYREADPAYFGTMDIPLIAGRAFNAGDDTKAPLVAIVNRTFVSTYLKDMEPVGQRLAMGSRDTALVVGVVGDVPIGSIEDKIPPTLYMPLAQSPETAMGMMIRTSAPIDQISHSVRAALSEIDPTAVSTAVTAMDDVIATSPSVFMRCFPLYLISAFALTALALAIVGIYGVVSYSVAQRTREMGIRMALGAQPSSLVTLVIRHGGRMGLAGVVVGVGVALIAGRFADKLLYGVHSGDPATYVLVALVLGIVAVAATLLPARRATRVDPAVALRSE
jgi:putative ABC transport system permease protein